jgi:hypothetical protein
MDSPQVLHIQHCSITIIFLLRKLSKIKIFPRIAVHKNNATLGGTLTFQILFQGEVARTGVNNT